MKLAFHNLRFLTYQLEERPKHKPPSESSSFHTLLGSTEKELQDLPLPTEYRRDRQIDSWPTIAKITHIGALIYLNLALRRLSTDDSKMRTLKTDFLTTLQAHESKHISHLHVPTCPSSLTWAIIMGSLLVDTKEEEIEFAERIVKGMKTMNARNWDALETELRAFAWIEDLRNDALERVWEKVQTIIDQVTKGKCANFFPRD